MFTLPLLGMGDFSFTEQPLQFCANSNDHAILQTLPILLKYFRLRSNHISSQPGLETQMFAHFPLLIYTSMPI